MKKLRDKIEHHVLKVEEYWKALSVKKQRLATKVFFGSYVFLTVIVLINILISTGKKNNRMSIDHIDGISEKPAEKAPEQNEIVESPIKK